MIHWRSGLELSKEVVIQRQAPETRNKKQELELSERTSRSHKVPTFNGTWRFTTVFTRALVLLCKKDPQIPHIKDNRLHC